MRQYCASVVLRIADRVLRPACAYDRVERIYPTHRILGHVWDSLQTRLTPDPAGSSTKRASRLRIWLCLPPETPQRFSKCIVLRRRAQGSQERCPPKSWPSTIDDSVMRIPGVMVDVCRAMGAPDGLHGGCPPDLSVRWTSDDSDQAKLCKCAAKPCTQGGSAVGELSHREL